jgi:hypothetical protein
MLPSPMLPSTEPPTARATSDAETPGCTLTNTSPSTKGAAPRSGSGGAAAAEMGADTSAKSTTASHQELVSFSACHGNPPYLFYCELEPESVPDRACLPPLRTRLLLPAIRRSRAVHREQRRRPGISAHSEFSLMSAACSRRLRPSRPKCASKSPSREYGSLSCAVLHNGMALHPCAGVAIFMIHPNRDSCKFGCVPLAPETRERSMRSVPLERQRPAGQPGQKAPRAAPTRPPPGRHRPPPATALARPGR